VISQLGTEERRAVREWENVGALPGVAEGYGLRGKPLHLFELKGKPPPSENYEIKERGNAPALRAPQEGREADTSLV